MPESPFLHLDRLAKRFGDTTVLSGLSLTIERGEIFALLGPSGSGKTTALRLLAGFETPDAGTIAVAGSEVTSLPPARRHFGMVFQHYALFPHLTVADNVAFGLSGRADRDRRVAEALALVDLPGFGARPVTELSGGQQQRVALARALAPEPRVLLLDEPLSNLDPALRERTRRELSATIRRVGITTVLVTHEQDEAFDLGDRVGVLNGGRLQQVGSPEELYSLPATRFVAGFVGRASALAGELATLEGRGGGEGGEGGRRIAAVTLADGAGGSVRWRGLLPDGGDPAGSASPAPGAAVELVVRPEALAFTAEGTPGALAGEVTDRRYAGPVTYYRVALARGDAVEVLAAADAARVGDRVRVGPAIDGAGQRGGPPPTIFPLVPHDEHAEEHGGGHGGGHGIER